MSDLIEIIANIVEEGGGDTLATATRVLQAIEHEGYAIVPKQATNGLLASMAMRWDHSFGMDRTELFSGYSMGYTPEMRRSLMTSMGQIHEEVVGTGFYRPDREANYAAIIDKGGNP